MRGTLLIGQFGHGLLPLILIGLIGIALIVIALVLFIKSKDNKGNKDDNSINVLKEMYAKGEINEDEFYKRATVLTGRPFVNNGKQGIS
jgi:uncharacterized membrane protein